MDQPIPLQRQAGEDSQSWKGAIAAPERHYLPNCKQASLLIKPSWDSERSTSAWEGARVAHPENRGAGTGEVISRRDRAHQTPGHLSCLDLGRAQNAGPTESAPLRTTRVPEPGRLRLGKCVQPRAGLRQFPPEQPRAWAVWAGRAHVLWTGASPVWLRHCEHTPVLFVCSVPLPHSAMEQVSLKMCPPPPPCVRAEIRHWRDQQTEEAKQRELPWKRQEQEQ